MYTESKQQKRWLPIVAAVGIGALSLSLRAGAADPVNPSDRPAAVEPSQPLSLPAGFQGKDLRAESGIKSGLVKLTDRAVTKGDFNSLLAELSKQDKERAREFKGVDQAKLDGVIDQIRKQWRDKYGQDFSINDKNLVFNQQFAIAQGTVSDPTVAISHWPVPALAGEAVTAGSRSPADNQKQEEKAAKLNKGRDVALVRFPASHDLPELTVSMLHQLPGFWRVDIPNDRTGEQIYNDLTAHLTYIRDHQNQWPNDVADGYRMVAHETVGALYGVPVPGSKG